MPFATVQFYGESVRKKTAMYVILPEGRGPFPVLYLLHGLSDDYTTWHRRTSIERYVEGKPLIVVMPDGHRSWYMNDPRPGGVDYEDHIAKDVVNFVDSTFHTVRRRGGRAIAGLSMGGFGAMMLGLKHHDKFCAISAHSGALNVCRARNLLHDDVQRHICALMACNRKGAYDCFALARRLKRLGRRMHIRFDCGVDDFLIQHNRDFHAHLDKLRLPHVYKEYPGAHTWDYWDTHIQETIEFVMNRM